MSELLSSVSEPLQAQAGQVVGTADLVVVILLLLKRHFSHDSVLSVRNSLRYNQASHREDAVMAELTFEQKQDHYHKIRRSNYLASLRLEGFTD